MPTKPTGHLGPDSKGGPNLLVDGEDLGREGPGSLGLEKLQGSIGFGEGSDRGSKPDCGCIDLFQKPDVFEIGTNMLLEGLGMPSYCSLEALRVGPPRLDGVLG